MRLDLDRGSAAESGMIILAAVAAISTLLLIGGVLWTLQRAGRLREEAGPARGFAVGGHVEVPLSVAIGWIRRREPVALPFLLASLGAAGILYGLGGLVLLLALRDGSTLFAAAIGAVLLYATVRLVIAVARAARDGDGTRPTGDRSRL